MNRIDVVGDAGRYKVMYNFTKVGVPLSTADQANKEAWALKKNYPKAEINYFKAD
tara:strand:- start:8036 stop:8200 length:165 start_codon:yes stop_codon:yes gene_type:complete